MASTDTSDIRCDWLVIIDLEDNKKQVKEIVKQASQEELANKAVEVLKNFHSIRKLSFEPINRTKSSSDQQV